MVQPIKRQKQVNTVFFQKGLLSCLFQSVKGLKIFQAHQAASPSTGGGGQDARSNPSLESAVYDDAFTCLYVR